MAMLLRQIQNYIKQNVISFIDDLLAPYANAWRIIEHPTDANLPDDIIGQPVSPNV